MGTKLFKQDLQVFTKMPNQTLDAPIDVVECGTASIACITQMGTLYVLGNIGISETREFCAVLLPSQIQHVSVGYMNIGITTRTYFP